MTTTKATEIIQIAGRGIVQNGSAETHKRGTTSVAVFELNDATFNASTNLNGFGGIDADTAGGGDFIVVGKVGAQPDTDTVTRSSSGGRVLIHGLELLSNGAFTIGTSNDFRLGIARKTANYANPLLTGSTSTIDSVAYDIQLISSTIAGTAAIGRIANNNDLKNENIYAQSDDLIVLYTGGTVTAGTKKLYVTASYTKLTPGGRIVATGAVV